MVVLIAPAVPPVRVTLNMTVPALSATLWSAGFGVNCSVPGLPSSLVMVPMPSGSARFALSGVTASAASLTLKVSVGNGSTVVSPTTLTVTGILSMPAGIVTSWSRAA